MSCQLSAVSFQLKNNTVETTDPTAKIQAASIHKNLYFAKGKQPDKDAKNTTGRGFISAA